MASSCSVRIHHGKDAYEGHMGSEKKIGQTRGAPRVWGGERMLSGCLVSQTQGCVAFTIFLLVWVSTPRLSLEGQKDAPKGHGEELKVPESSSWML